MCIHFFLSFSLKLFRLLHAGYVENACMFDVNTETYCDAFDRPMRFALHALALKEVEMLLYQIIVAVVARDFYFRSQTVTKLYIHYFSYSGLYIYVQLAFSPAIYTLWTKNTLCEKTRICCSLDKRESGDVQWVLSRKSCGMETDLL